MKKIDEFEIEKTLIISTAHITHKDDKLMTSHENGGHPIANLMCDYHTFSHTVILGDDIRDEVETYADEGFSKDFVKCIKLGIYAKVKNIRFDSDGKTYESLNVNSW